jgi:hypothetical protein
VIASDRASVSSGEAEALATRARNDARRAAPARAKQKQNPVLDSRCDQLLDSRSGDANFPYLDSGSTAPAETRSTMYISGVGGRMDGGGRVSNPDDGSRVAGRDPDPEYDGAEAAPGRKQ